MWLTEERFDALSASGFRRSMSCSAIRTECATAITQLRFVADRKANSGCSHLPCEAPDVDEAGLHLSSLRNFGVVIDRLWGPLSDTQAVAAHLSSEVASLGILSDRCRYNRRMDPTLEQRF